MTSPSLSAQGIVLLALFFLTLFPACDAAEQSVVVVSENEVESLPPPTVAAPERPAPAVHQTAAQYSDPPTPRPTPIPTPSPTALIAPTPEAGHETVPPPFPTDVVHSIGPKTPMSVEAALIRDAGVLLFEAGQYADAIAKFEAAMEEVGEPVRILHTWIGQSYRMSGDMNQAIFHFSRAIEIFDNSSDRANRAITYQDMNLCAEAMEDSYAALGMEPFISEGSHSYLEAHLALATCLTRGERYSEALEHMTKGLAIANGAGVRQERMDGLNGLKSDIEAVADGSMDLENFFAAKTFHFIQQGLAYLNAGDFQEAIKTFESARARHWRKSSGIFNFLGQSYAGAGNHETAILNYSKAIELRDDAYNRVFRASQYFAYGDCEPATADALVALEQPLYVDARMHTASDANWIVGYCLGAEGQLEEAVNYLEKSIRLARSSNYSAEEIEGMNEVYEGVQALLEGN
ncbi:MAG: tetratricopeptide repeat protein [Chloroflexi bacterium]|nr:tetratricopeptide repeat protein [Chloroflexota bacterium]